MGDGFGTTAMIGAFDPREGSILQRAAERANAYVHSSASILDSEDELSALRPQCIFVDGHGKELSRTTTWLREHPTLFCTQVIAMVSDLRDSSFVQAYRNGADDVIVRSNLGGVTRRLANLQQFNPCGRPPVARGRVLISHGADEHRRRFGRVLRQASFDVHFALDEEEIVDAMSSETAPELIVVSGDVLSADRIAEVRRAAGATRTPFVIVATAASTRMLMRSGLERVATVSESAPHDHLLFLANDLLRDGDRRRMRNSPRYLFDTICSFRSAGDFSPEYGLTYNLSETGIYVRTLDPPPKNADLWLELRPPGTAMTVHLRGTLVWVAMPGRGGRGTPPGFGLRIDEESSPASDLEAYRQAYSTLAELPPRLALSWLP
jgi:DNA-binding response OmpR family regulator